MEEKPPAPDTAPDEVLLAFAERYLADQDAGRGVQLADYLRIWPEHQVAVAREYLAARQQAEGGTVDPASAGTGTFGPFRIEREIGRGGQGAVYLAEDTRLHRKVALKVILRLGQDAGAQLRRFRREAEVASQLELPGICGVHEVGMEDGVPFIAMPYLEGETLAARIARLRAEGAVAADRAEVLATLLLFEQVARILHRAHTAGILHRDLKPANIMITPGGGPVLFDFGLAALLDPTGGAALTESGDLLGTPMYMSPEQIAGRVQLDRRTDVYSLGISLYESLTLQKPFAATTREGLFHAILDQVPADPRQWNRAIPADLRCVLDMAIEKDRDRRYQSAADFADDLRAVREGRPTLARRIGPLGRLWRWSRREPAVAALLAALLMALPTIAALVTARLKDLPHVEAARHALAEEHRATLLLEATHELTEGDARAAARLFASALEIPGPAGEAAGGLVLAQLRLHDAAGALALLDEHREDLGAGAATFALRAEALRAQGREAEAVQLLQQAPAPTTALDHQLLATQALRNCEHGAPADFGLAFAHATGAILLSPRPYLLHYELRLHAAGHRVARDAIVETVAALVHRWPSSARARFRCGWALKMLEDPALFGGRPSRCNPATRVRTTSSATASPRKVATAKRSPRSKRVSGCSQPARRRT
jgi:serine/threonine protein kinase